MVFVLKLTFLFAVGSMIGWGIEVIYRRFVSQKHWVNPGFLTGPCLPLYGESLCLLYLLAQLEEGISIDSVWLRKLILFIIMAIAITCLEYFVGSLMIKTVNIRLWDYSEEWGNIKGIICPKYTFFWMILSALYYFLVHPHILDSLEWLANNLIFSFFIGFFYGIFVIDLAYSVQLLDKIHSFAYESDIVVHLEEFREYINDKSRNIKPKFLLSLNTKNPLREYLEQYRENHFTNTGRKQ